MGAGADRDDFLQKVVRILAMRASYICSNPGCRYLTLGPSPSDPEKIIFLGVGAHITAASPGGPRYDATLTSRQRSSIENGIFLCQACAAMIDKNGGRDFGIEILRRWKSEHEEWVRANLNKSVHSLVKSRLPVPAICFDDGSARLEILKVKSAKKKGDDKAELGDRIIRLDLQLVNLGDAPASDVHVFIELAGAYQVYSTAQLRRRWETYPHNFLDDPKIFLERITRSRTMPAFQRLAGEIADSFGFAAFELGIAPDRKKPKNVTSRDVGPTLDDRRAIFHVKKLKQNLAHTFEPLYIVFNSWQEVASFSVQFRVNAQELSADVEGMLEVSVKKGRAAAKNR
jgi:hypothetical protein